MALCQSPVALGLWLYKQRLALGIEFRMNSQAVSVRHSVDNRLQALSLMDKNREQSTLISDNLGLAAGPCIPAVFKALFPHALIKLQAVLDAGDWIISENTEPRSAKPIAAVYFEEIVGKELEFACRNDPTVWVTGEHSPIGTLSKFGDAPEPDEKTLLKLLANATISLKHKQGDDSDSRIVKQGQSLRSETPSRLLVITAVPGCKLTTRDTTFPSDDPRPRVFTNSGHGSHSITLGIGSGKAMSQFILGRNVSSRESSGRCFGR